jgi:competence protein ComEA
MQKGELLRLFKEYRLQLIFLSLGIIFVIIGLIYKNSSNINNSKIEVVEDVSSSSLVSTNETEIIVDVRGSVENPGVYKLPFGSRVEDALIKAGGVSENADRSWLDKNLDRAAKLTDGQKIYIPDEQSNSLTADVLSDKTSVAQSNTNSISTPININTASLSELDSLPGIGQVYGQKIIDHRPYSSLDELVGKAVISQSLFEKIKDKISM